MQKKPITFKEVLITPGEASQLLQLNIENNRNIKPQKVKQYADDIVNGRWIPESGETLKLNKQGKLIDGQNRLRAVIEAGVPVTMWIASNCSDDAFAVLDEGQRTAADTFKISKIPYYQYSVTIAKGLYAYINYNGRTSAKSISNQKLLSFYYENEKTIQKSIELGAKIIYNRQRTKLIAPSYLLVFTAILVFNSVSPDAITRFLNQFTSGTEAVSAIACAREYLYEKKTKKDIIPMTIQIELLYKTWNNYISGRHNVKSFNPDGEIPDLMFTNV